MTAKHHTTEDAVKLMRSNPAYEALIRDTYLDEDVLAAAARFETAGEWKAIVQLLGVAIEGAVVLDLGAGNGIASRAFARAGATRVIAIEPDPSDLIGCGAIARVCGDLPVEIREGFGEKIPLEDETADLVFARQVLHHTRELDTTLQECARVLRPGGLFLACREHVADTPEELQSFLASHPVHALTGGEHAYTLGQYRHAIDAAGFALAREIGPWDSVINLYPAVDSDAEIATYPQRILRERLGTLGALAAAIPFVSRRVASRLRRPRPGRLYTFLAQKP